MFQQTYQSIQIALASVSSVFSFFNRNSASASATSLPQQVAPQTVAITTPEHIAEVISTKNVWSLYEVLASSGLTTS